MNSKRIAIIVSIALGSKAVSSAQVLFSDTLQSASDTAWTVNHSGSDYQAVFGFDYSTIGIPSDPYSTSGSTTGLKLQINQTAGVLQGVSLSPTGFGVTGNFTMTFDMFCNYIYSGNGSTQVANYGVGTSGTSAVWSVNNDGLELGNIIDNGSGTSYRGYLKGANLGSTPFVGGSQSYASTYHQSLFPSVSVPAGEVALYPSQAGSSTAGTVSFQWVQVSISVVNGIANESIDGNLIATNMSMSTLTSSNVFLGMYDTTAGSANANPDLNMVIYQDFSVTATPEPTGFALALVGASGLFLVCRRNFKA